MLKEISLAGKTALITGGATGIGFAIATEMIDAGAQVIIIGRRLEMLQRAADQLGPACTYHQFDITNFESLPEFVQSIEEHSPIDILVNNAGNNNKKDFLEFTTAEFDTIAATQAKAPFFLTQEVAKYMKKRGKGSVIFISSLATLLGMHNIQAYTVCKSGIVGLARSLTLDLAPFGIRVNSLNPGFVYTEMLQKTNLKTPARLQEIENKTPLRGFTQTKDLGMAAAFLASDAARFITGIDLVVDGGISSSFLI